MVQPTSPVKVRKCISYILLYTTHYTLDSRTHSELYSLPLTLSLKPDIASSIFPSSRIFPLQRQAYACTMLSNVQDGGRCAMSHINASGEPVVPRTATGSAASALTTAQVFGNHLWRSRLANGYNDLWLEFQLDAILVPSVAHPANPHGEYISNSYATVYNMLDYVTGCVPVTIVNQRLDVAGKDWYDSNIYERFEAVCFPYDRGDKEMKELCELHLIRFMSVN